MRMTMLWVVLVRRASGEVFEIKFTGPEDWHGAAKAATEGRVTIPEGTVIIGGPNPGGTAQLVG